MTPAPQPLEGVQGPMTGYLPSGQEGGARMNTISLGVLIDFIIQRTYQDLTVLSELLPRKTDMERKIEIFNFSSRTRKLFIRLIALVKWANSVSKVDKSANIMNFLDKQNMLFVETADVLASMARESLVRARLPNFHIPAAVEVLTTGNYNRLPSCIRDRILPPEPITTVEKKQTLFRLNQVIIHRLVTSELPPQMRDFKIKNGRVVFEVKHEFNVSLTVMGDGNDVPWRLLHFDILVEDKETGDGKPLVHPLQVNYIHQLIQARLTANPNALSEVYHMLHYFCQSLQLEVLYTQTLRLIVARLDDKIHVEEYVPGVKITVSYWREYFSKDPKSELGYRLTVKADNSGDDARQLSVVHLPSLNANENLDITKRAVRTDHLSMERLIVHTVYVRSVSRLNDLRVEFQGFLKDVDFNLQGTPAILTVPVLTPCLRAEQIHITIDTHTGLLRCHVPKHLDCPIMKEMEACLNGDHAKLQNIISDLRFWITHRRCEKTLQHLPATAMASLPFLKIPDIPLLQKGLHKIFVKLHRHPNVVLIVQMKEKLSKPNEMDYTFYLAFMTYISRDTKEPGLPGLHASGTCSEYATALCQAPAAASPGSSSSIANSMLPPMMQPAASSTPAATPGSIANLPMVSMSPNVVQQTPPTPIMPNTPNMQIASGGIMPLVPMATNMNMGGSFGASNVDNAQQLSNAANITMSMLNVNQMENMPKPYVSLMRLIEFDTFVAMHGRGTDVDEVLPHKRKSIGDQGTPAKQQKTIYPAYFIPELAHVIAMCDEKIPFLNLAQEFSRHNIPNSGLHVESNATAMALKLLALPRPPSGGYKNAQQNTSLNVSTGSIMGSMNASGSGKETAVGMNAIFNDVNTANFPVIEDQIWEDLTKRLMSISIRSQMNKNNQIRIWVVEIVFGGTPLSSLHPKEQGQRRTVSLTYEQANNDFSKTVLDLLKDWSKIVYLYTLVYKFNEFYTNPRFNMPDIVSIQSYSYMNLLLGYGPKMELSCNIYWSSQLFAFRLTFIGGISAINAHSMMREALTMHLNSRYNLTHIVYLLHETYSPLSSIARLQIIPQLGIPRPQVPVLSFCILTQSPSLVRLAFQAVFCLEVRLLANKLVSIRDGAYSRFDRSLIDEFTPIQGLKGFLNKYVDENSSHRGHAHNEDDNPPSPTTVLEEVYGGPASVSGATSTGGSSPFLSAGMRGPQSPRDSGLRFPTPHTPPSSSNPHTPASPHPVVGVSHSNFNLTSPPAPHMPHPSPGSLMPSSPLNPQPSPHMVHSPGPNALYMQSHQDSPFAAMSPANTNWPGSPSMPRPSPRPGQSPEHKPTTAVTQSALSRANRSWAGAVPTLLTHEALDVICRPCQHPNKDMLCPEISPLERFLGCVYMRRQLQRLVQNEDTLQALSSNEPGMVLFKVDGFQCQVTLNPLHMQGLHLKITQLTPTPDVKSPFSLTPEDLMVIEQFFDLRVAVPPYRPNALNTFCRLLSFAPQVLKDFVQIMRLDLKPDLGGDQLKWSVQFCMRVPPSCAPIIPIGSPGVLMCRLKILFFLQLTRIPYNGKDWKDSPSIVLPMVYDLNTNITQLAERREQGVSMGAAAVSAILRRFLEYGGVHGPCSLFPAVRDLLMNLQLPHDTPPLHPPQSTQVMGGPVGVSGVVSAGASPMMHSPMQQIGGVGGGIGPGVYQPMGQTPGPPPGSQ